MNVVITGSTRGIGRGMAGDFVARGHNVFVSGREAGGVDAAVANLNSAGPGTASGIAADTAKIDDVRNLWNHAERAFGTVDIWINNAGVTHRKLRLVDLPDEQISSVVATNVVGLMNGCKVALTGMLRQGHGKIFNMEGFGSDGMVQPGMAIYGATKSAVRYFTKSLVREYKDTPLIIGYMSPGIVVTDLLTRDLHDTSSEDFRKRRRFLNILADRVETVTPRLVDGALAASKTGATIRWMTPAQALGRLLKSPFVSRDPFGTAGLTE